MIFVEKKDNLIQFDTPLEAITFSRWVEAKDGYTCKIHTDIQEYIEKYGFIKIVHGM